MCQDSSLGRDAVYYLSYFKNKIPSSISEQVTGQSQAQQSPWGCSFLHHFWPCIRGLSHLFFIHINTLKYVFNISPRFSPTLCWSLWDNNLYVTTVAGERSSTELFSFVCFVWVLERILMYTAFLVLSWFLSYISSGAYFTAGDYDLRDFEVILFSQELLFLGKSQMSLRNSSLNT